MAILRALMPILLVPSSLNFLSEVIGTYSCKDLRIEKEFREEVRKGTTLQATSIGRREWGQEAPLPISRAYLRINETGRPPPLCILQWKDLEKREPQALTK